MSLDVMAILNHIHHIHDYYSLLYESYYFVVLSIEYYYVFFLKSFFIDILTMKYFVYKCINLSIDILKIFLYIITMEYVYLLIYVSLFYMFQKIIFKLVIL